LLLLLFYLFFAFCIQYNQFRFIWFICLSVIITVLFIVSCAPVLKGKKR